MNHAISHRSRLRSALAMLTMLWLVFAVPLMAAEEEAAPDTWGPAIAKMVNFAILAGALYYFFGKSAAEYLRARGETIRKDLVDAKTLRADAETQLAGVRERLAKLPAELSTLKQRGQEELASEKVRLADATAAERTRVQEQTRREIEVASRLARRDLMVHSANLSMDLAKKRLERDITAEDQARLIDSYKPEVRQ